MVELSKDTLRYNFGPIVNPGDLENQVSTRNKSLHYLMLEWITTFSRLCDAFLMRLNPFAERLSSIYTELECIPVPAPDYSPECSDRIRHDMKYLHESYRLQTWHEVQVNQFLAVSGITRAEYHAVRGEEIPLLIDRALVEKIERRTRISAVKIRTILVHLQGLMESRPALDDPMSSYGGSKSYARSEGSRFSRRGSTTHRTEAQSEKTAPPAPKVAAGAGGGGDSDPDKKDDKRRPSGRGIDRPPRRGRHTSRERRREERHRHRRESSRSSSRGAGRNPLFKGGTMDQLTVSERLKVMDKLFVIVRTMERIDSSKYYKLPRLWSSASYALKNLGIVDSFVINTLAYMAVPMDMKDMINDEVFKHLGDWEHTDWTVIRDKLQTQYSVNKETAESHFNALAKKEHSNWPEYGRKLQHWATYAFPGESADNRDKHIKRKIKAEIKGSKLDNFTHERAKFLKGSEYTQLLEEWVNVLEEGCAKPPKKTKVGKVEGKAHAGKDHTRSPSPYSELEQYKIAAYEGRGNGRPNRGRGRGTEPPREPARTRGAARRALSEWQKFFLQKRSERRAKVCVGDKVDNCYICEKAGHISHQCPDSQKFYSDCKTEFYKDQKKEGQNSKFRQLEKHFARIDLLPDTDEELYDDEFPNEPSDWSEN